MARKVEVLGFWTAFASAGSGGDVGETAVVELGAVVGLLMFPPAHGPDQPNDPGVADLGYRLTTSAWGRGYAREAVAMLLDRSRFQLRWPRAGHRADARGQCQVPPLLARVSDARRAWRRRRHDCARTRSGRGSGRRSIRRPSPRGRAVRSRPTWSCHTSCTVLVGTWWLRSVGEGSAGNGHPMASAKSQRLHPDKGEEAVSAAARSCRSVSSSR